MPRNADQPIPFAVTDLPVPFRMGDVAPAHAFVTVTCAGCGAIVAKPRGTPLVCPLGCTIVVRALTAGIRKMARSA